MRMQLRLGASLTWFRLISFGLIPLLLVVLLCCSLLCAQAFAAGGVAYRGLTPGISTLNDTLRLLGKPVSKVYSDDRIVYKYRFVQVNIPQKSGKVQFILIYDPSFQDVNGFRLGSRYNEIREKLKVDGVGNSIVDPQNGIGYIFTSNGLVDQIVYGIVR
ncbi:MAG: hypothetical protein AB7U29_19225 [Desulfobulbus sp.]